MNWDEQHRPEKAKARKLAIGFNQQAVKCALMLPSSSCHDLKMGLETGLFDKNTFIIAVEQNKHLVGAIKRFLSKNFKNYYLYITL